MITLAYCIAMADLAGTAMTYRQAGERPSAIMQRLEAEGHRADHVDMVTRWAFEITPRMSEEGKAESAVTFRNGIEAICIAEMARQRDAAPE